MAYLRVSTTHSVVQIVDTDSPASRIRRASAVVVEPSHRADGLHLGPPLVDESLVSSIRDVLNSTIGTNPAMAASCESRSLLQGLLAIAAT